MHLPHTEEDRLFRLKLRAEVWATAGYPLTLVCLIVALLIGDTVLLNGCHALSSRSKAAPPPAPFIADAETDVPTKIVQALPAAADNNPSVIGPEYERYYVGMIADGEDPTIAYRPGDLYVQRKPARLRLNGPAADGEAQFAFYRGPKTTEDIANMVSNLTPDELETFITRSRRALGAATEQNQLLMARISELEKLSTVSTSGQAAGLPTPAHGAGTTAMGPAPLPPEHSAPNGPTGDDPFDPKDLNIVRDRGDGVIELSPDLFITPTETTGNPFVQLYHPQKKGNPDIQLVVSGAIPGPNPTCILNDKTYGVNDIFEGLYVYRIDSDQVFLRKGTFLLECPVSDKTLLLRLP